LKIKRKNTYGIIEGDSDDRPKISYCPRCLESGYYEVLGKRILMPDEEVPRDYDSWSQCPTCGLLLAKHEQKYETELEESVDTLDNPHDMGKEILGLDNKRPRTKREKERKRLLDKANREKDSEIRIEIVKGNVIEDLSDY
jgi:ribosomal protein S27AE